MHPKVGTLTLNLNGVLKVLSRGHVRGATSPRLQAVGLELHLEVMTLFLLLLFDYGVVIGVGAGVVADEPGIWLPVEELDPVGVVVVFLAGFFLFIVVGLAVLVGEAAGADICALTTEVKLATGMASAIPKDRESAMDLANLLIFTPH